VNERKFLNPSARVDFTGVQISVGILDNLVHVVKLACISARVTDRASDRAVAPMNDPISRYHGNFVRRGSGLISYC
jgi:hypothetical protein